MNKKAYMDESICLDCKHKWLAICPNGLEDLLQCPKCHTSNGVWFDWYERNKGDQWIIDHAKEIHQAFFRRSKNMFICGTSKLKKSAKESLWGYIKYLLYLDATKEVKGDPE